MTQIKEEKLQLSGCISEAGRAHTRSTYWTYPNPDLIVAAADVTVDRAKNCVKYPVASKLGNRAVVVKADFKVPYSGDNFYVFGTLVVTLEEYGPYMGAQKSEVDLEEVVFDMKENTPGQIASQTRQLLCHNPIRTGSSCQKGSAQPGSC